LITDHGYISQALFEQLLETFNVQLITRIKKNMKNRLIPMIEKLLLRKQAIIESVMDQLKNISQIEHTRHRSLNNAFINIIRWFDRLLSSIQETFLGYHSERLAFARCLNIIHVK
jgi:transcriptional regulator NrdR family protein